MDIEEKWEIDGVIEIKKPTDEKRFNPNHDSKTGKFTSKSGSSGSSSSGGKEGSGGSSSNGGSGSSSSKNPGRKYGETNTEDAIEEINSGKHNSVEKYLDKDGKLTAERDQLHKDIIDQKLDGKKSVEGQATMTMLGGGPASRKK